MKQFIAAFLLLFAVSLSSVAQQTQDSFKLYNPKADARHEIMKAVSRAAREHKHVFLQIGGN